MIPCERAIYDKCGFCTEGVLLKKNMGDIMLEGFLSKGNEKRDRKIKKAGRRRSSVIWRFSFNLMAVLIPALGVMIAIACAMASESITDLNKKLLDVQTNYALSIVDDFFGTKTLTLSMYEKDGMLQEYFQAVSAPEDIDNYEGTAEVVQEMAAVLANSEDDDVLQVWIADDRTDYYMLSTGEKGEYGIDDMEWYHMAKESQEPIISNPYIDPITGIRVVSIVTPVFSEMGTEILGYMGIDVSMESLAELLSEIKVGENGFMELISSVNEYIYTDDHTLIDKNVDELNITDEYKKKVRDNYNGTYDFAYEGVQYTAIFKNSEMTKWLAIATLPISEMNATRNYLIFILVIMSIIVLAGLTYVVIMIVRRMMRPLSEISGGMKEFANGKLDVDFNIKRDDEIGSLAESARSSIFSLKEMIEDISFTLGEISSGNLGVQVKGNYVGDFESIKKALEQIIISLNNTLGQINGASEQVSLGSEQVSEGAQSLAQGASEQAGTVEELATSIHEISQQITSNADNSKNANKKASAVGREAIESNQRMQEMLAAMKNIQESSRKIANILKVIEDIAFQTNILALNAAVEAARAGESGRGFSVVAGEVRNLATKSSEAAKDTTVLLKSSLKAVEDGTRIADETAESLEKVVKGAEEVAQALDEITKASNEQAEFVEQVTHGVEQISNVIQGNSATAEESAAASEELSAQSLLLKDLIGKFKF